MFTMGFVSQDHMWNNGLFESLGGKLFNFKKPATDGNPRLKKSEPVKSETNYNLVKKSTFKTD